MRSFKTAVHFFLLLAVFVASAVGQGTLTFPPKTFPNAVVGNLTDESFNISGGTTPYTLTLTSGTLPPGLNIDNAEVGLTGTPTAPNPSGQPYTFTITVTDSSTPTPQTASQSFSINVITNPLAIMPAASLPGGLAGEGYNQVYAQGGIPPYNWVITQGTLPASSGLTLTAATSGQNNFGQPSYAINGTPSIAGTYSFTLQITDSSPTPLQATATYTLSVINPVAYLPPPSSSVPTGIAATSNDLWFTQQGGTVGVQSVTTAGTFEYETQLTSSVVTPKPEAITAGPDGNLWITDLSSSYIYKVTPNGSSVTTISLQRPSVPPVQVVPTGITSASDGGVWFTGNGSDQQGYVGRISADGSNTLSFYPLPQYISAPTSIVPDPDGTHLWFLAQAGDPASIVVGRIGTDGTYEPPAGCQVSPPVPNFGGCFILNSQGKAVSPPIPLLAGSLVGPVIAVGSEGGIWFATNSQEIGKISSDGSAVSFYPIPTSAIGSMVLAPDSAIWYTLQDTNILGRITSSGQTTSFNITSPGSPVFSGITVGPDGALWMTDNNTNYLFQIFPSLVLNCTVPGTLQVGVAISNASCTAAGGKGPYTYSYNSANLPPGVMLNSSTGVLSGTPTGPGFLIITANDSSSPPQQASQVFSIQAAAPIQLDCSGFPATGVAGQSYYGTCTTAGGNAPYTYQVTPSLPAGLTGVATTPPAGSAVSGGYSVSGTLSPALYGTATFTITAFDSSTPPSTSAPQKVTIAITPVPVSVSCNPNAQAVVSSAFRQTCYGFRGNPPYTFTAAGLPAGLTMGAANGAISGTPSATGQSSVSVVVTDSTGQAATTPVALSVISPKLALACNFPFNPTTGTAISISCSASGGKAPYSSYSVSAGTLPAGLKLEATTGVISGTPTSAGPANFTLLVTDSESPALTAQQSVSLFVHPTALTILSTTLPVPTPPLPYAAAPSVEGGSPPYTFFISAGALPVGLTLAPSGTIYTAQGASVASGAYSFTLQVKDSTKATVTQTYSGTVAASPVAASFDSYALPTPGGANGITVGPDGNLWFTTLDQQGGNMIGRITTAGAITTTPAANALTQGNPSSFELPMGGDIAAGPDGEIWFAQRDANAVGEVTLDLASQLTYIPQTANSGPAQITAAPDGTLWFTETAAGQIAHVSAAGNMQKFATKSASSGPYGIAVGPDNFIAFTEAAPSVNKIGVISEDGTTSIEFAIPTAASLPTSIVVGPDSAFWFTEFGANKIGRMDFGGNFSEVQVSGAPQAITLGPDGALYFTETAANKIGRITIAGGVTEIPVPDANSGPIGIVAGPDGAVWFTESNLSKIGRLSFILGPKVTCNLPASLVALSIFSGTCMATGGTPPYQFTFSNAAGSTPPPGVTLNSTTGALSGTLTTAGTFSFTVVATDSTSPPLTGQQTYSYTVTPLPLTLTCNTPTALLYTSYAGTSQAYGCTAANGTPPYAYAIASGSVPPGLSFDPATGNIAGTPTTLGNYSLTVQITDSSTPAMVATQVITIPVQYGLVTSTGGPLFTLSTAPLSVEPGVNTPGLILTVNQPLLQPVSGSAVLTFTLASSLLGTANTPSNYVDPALQFVDGSGKPLGKTYNFTFQPATTSITLPAIDPGTVLGTVDMTINAAGLPQTATTFPVTGDTVVIEPGSVQFTNVSAGGFDIEFIAMTPTRSASIATITFNPSSGDQISGQQTFAFNVSTISNAWFASSESLQYGGRFSLTFSFVFNGSISAIGSATATLDNSQPVTGNR